MTSWASLAAANLAIDKVQQLQQFHVILRINYTATTNIVLRGTKLNGNAIFMENVKEMASPQTFCEYLCSSCEIHLLFRPHLWGEERYTQMGFFLFREFWPTDIFIVEKCVWYH